MSETKPGMSSWTEDDIRRIVQDVLRENERMNMERMLAAIGYKIVEQQDTNRDAEIERLRAIGDRLCVLATKWCDREHHDWTEIMDFYKKLEQTE